MSDELSCEGYNNPCSSYFGQGMAMSFDYLPSEVADEIAVNHPLYKKFEHCWQVMRDSVEGQDAVRENAIKMDYLQIPPGISQTGNSKNPYSCAYDKTAQYHYINKAHYIEVVPRILDEIEGRIFSKTYKLAHPSRLDIDKLDSDGLTFDQYTRWCVREVFAVSRFGVLVDWDNEDQKPILKRYVAESIVNWKLDRKGNLRLVVLEDEIEDDGQIFSHNTIKRRISFTTETDTDGNRSVVQRTWIESDKDAKGNISFEESEDPITLERSGRVVEKIPFIFFGGVKPTAPMLKPLAATALAYFDAYASYRNALWWSSNEQPYFTFDTDENAGFIGYNGQELEGDIEVLYGYASPLLLRGGELKFAGVKGTGLEHMYRNLKDLKSVMTGMGARSFNAQTASNIKVQTERMQQRAEGSVIGSISQAISIGIKEALDLAAEWGQYVGKISFELNKDYTDDFEFKNIPELIDARDAKIVSDIRVFTFLQNNTDLIPDGLTYEEHISEFEHSIQTDRFSSFDGFGDREDDFEDEENIEKIDELEDF